MELFTDTFTTTFVADVNVPDTFVLVVAVPEPEATGPWVVRSSKNFPCLIGMGDFSSTPTPNG